LLYPIYRRVKMKIVTLITDFLSDLYIGQIKGVILSINPEINLIDISHRVQSYNILEAAFLVSQVYAVFPTNSLHLAVVDPTVGSRRRGIIVKTEKYYLVGPDNGLFSLILTKEKPLKIYEINLKKFPEASLTFQARDIFAPVVGYLSLEYLPEKFGREIKKIQGLKLKEGVVLFVDGFGNIITNVKKKFRPGEKLIVEYRGRRIQAQFVRTFAEGRDNEFIVLTGSSGFLELDKNKESAAKDLGIKVGDKIRIKSVSAEKFPVTKVK